MILECIASLGSHVPGKSLLRRTILGCAALVFCLPNLGFAQDGDPDHAFLPNPVRSVSTVPTSGDLNPYGVAFVPSSIAAGGVIQPGDILVSNFNDSANTQGTGGSIVRISANGVVSTFFQAPAGFGPIGLTTALGVLKAGFVIVGSLPTDSNGVPLQGSLLILNSNGQVVENLSDSTLLDGPWDLAINDHGGRANVFVSNVLSGTVSRLDFSIPSGGVPRVMSEITIASGYGHRTDPNALVVGPTGLAFDPARDTLYVASTVDNAIFAVSSAAHSQKDNGPGSVIYQDPVRLHGPLALAAAPNSHLIVSNGDAVNPDPNQLNEIVEFTKDGTFVKQLQVDPGPAGGAFGLAIHKVSDDAVQFAAVDDNTNSLIIWTLPQVR